MEIELYTEFTMVAKHGNLSEAARELHVTESVLSRHLKTLETDMEFELFDRTTKPMRLTTIGELFLPIASEAGNVAKRIEAFRDENRRAPFHTVRIRGLIDGATLPLLRKTNAAFTAKNSHIVPKLVAHEYQTPFEDIRNGNLDIAIEPVSELIDHHELSWFHLVFEDACIVMKADNPLLQHKSFGFDDLAELKITSLRSNRDNATRKHLQELCRLHGLIGDIPRNLTIAPVDSYDELFAGDLGDYAIMLPRSIAARYAGELADEYVVRPFIGEGSAYDICAFYHEDAPAYVHDYLAELKECAG